MNNIFGKVSAKLLAMLLLALLCIGALPGSGSITPAFAVPPNRDASSGGSDVRALVLQVYFRSEAERQSLALEFGVEEVRTADLFLTVWGDEASYRDLLARGLRVEINAEMTAEANKPVLRADSPDTFYGGYHTVEEVNAFLTSSAQAHPLLAEKVDIGDSWCKSHPGACILPTPSGGYDLWALHITNQAIPGPKPVFWFDAGIHSREIATPELAMRFISWLLDGYDTNADAHWLVDYHDIWVLPMVNPDGHHIVEAGGGGSSPYLQRKNADNDDGCLAWPPSDAAQFGVDLNRNFTSYWACCGHSSPDPCHLEYQGPAPGSEDEAQAVMSKVRSLIPDQRGPSESDAAPITTTGILQTMHSFGAVHVYPSRFQPNPVLNAGDMENIAHHMAAPDVGGTGYDSCDMPGCYAIIDGATIMWAYDELGIPAFTTEISGNGFFPAYSQVDSLWEQNRGSLVYMAKIARTPYLTTRGPDANAVTVQPGVVLVGGNAHLSAVINAAWQGNLYADSVAAAEYYIDTPPWAGGIPIALQPSDGTYNGPTESVQAEISTLGLAPGKHIIFVRGRNDSTYEGYPSWGPISAAFLEVVTTLPSATPTSTAGPATATATPTFTPQPTHASATATRTAPATATATSAPCTVEFSDVPPGSTFYANIRCLACRGVLGGYSDGTFRPNNQITRGQIAKVVSNAAGYTEPPGTPIFEDVPEGSPFYVWVQRLAHRGYMGGYSCGLVPQEPCGANKRPYFRPAANATRGQLAKIVASTAQVTGTPTGQRYADVAPGSTFYVWIEQLSSRGVMGGYACGSVPTEPCDDHDRPYFRPSSDVTRGQASKIVANTFYPNCQTQASARP